MPSPPPWPPPPGPPRPSALWRVARYASALLAVLVAVYLVTVALVEPPKRRPPGIDQLGGMRVTLTAQPGPDGSPPSADTMAKAQQTVGDRLKGLGVLGAQVAVAGETLVVTVPGNSDGPIRDIATTGRLHIRPVIHAVPAQPASAPPAPPPGNDHAKKIASEKEWRQSTTPGVQMLGLQLEATRCDGSDILAGNDDPALPLVTCSTDHQTAYLLAPSVLGNDAIQSAAPNIGRGTGGHVVDLKFTADGTKIWADYTAAHIGSQAAFTLDSQVVSAPTIQEAIPGGQTQISGGPTPFTEADARALANSLSYRPLPVNFERSDAQAVPPQPRSAAPKSGPGLMSPPVGVIAALIVLLAILVCAQLFWIFGWIRT